MPLEAAFKMRRFGPQPANAASENKHGAERGGSRPLIEAHRKVSSLARRESGLATAAQIALRTPGFPGPLLNTGTIAEIGADTGVCGG